MVQKTRLASVLGVGVALLVGGVANAQTTTTTRVTVPSSPMPGGAPGAYGAPGSYSTQTSAQTAPGAVNNASVSSSTTTESSAVGGEYADESAPLAQTGGEPWMMTLLGASVAVGALALRRRIN